MSKLVMKLVFSAFLLMYLHQAFEHVSHCHVYDHGHKYTSLVHNAHMQHERLHKYQVINTSGESADHECQMHHHFPECHPKYLKPFRKNSDYLTGAHLNCASPGHFCSSISYKLPQGIGTQPNSMIPQYLRAQSFLI